MQVFFFHKYIAQHLVAMAHANAAKKARLAFITIE